MGRSGVESPSTEPSSENSAATLSALARGLYRGAERGERWLATLRPYICPFEVLMPFVPRGAIVLDVGCGNGLFLNLLAKQGHIEAGIGVEIDRRKIARAKEVAHENGLPLAYRHEREGPLSLESKISFVSALDVLHHVPLNEQRGFVDRLLAKVPRGGQLLIKDMSSTPRWMAAMNQAHDLLLARQWVHLPAPGDLRAWIRASGLEIVSCGSTQRLWYGHYWLLACRPS